MTRVVDADGTPLRRTPDGDLVPDLPVTVDRVPDNPPMARCAEHGAVYGELAARCRYCHAEAKARDRPWSAIGRTYPTVAGRGCRR